MLDGETKPPPLLTEADLIALMEKHGIGKIKTCTSANCHSSKWILKIFKIFKTL